MVYFIDFLYGQIWVGVLGLGKYIMIRLVAKIYTQIVKYMEHGLTHLQIRTMQILD